MSHNGRANRNFNGQVLRKSNNSFRRRMANGHKKFSEELQDHLAKKALAENERKRACKASKEKDGSSFVHRVWNAVHDLLGRISTFSQQFCY